MATVRKITTQDIEIVAPLFDAYRVFYRKSSDLEAAITFLRDRVEREESIIYIVEEGGLAVGFTQLYPLFSSTKMKRIWLLNDLYVDADQRGKGYSKILINAAKQLARDTDAAGVSLETEISNIVGNKLYHAVDFKMDKDHNYYFWSSNL